MSTKPNKALSRRHDRGVALVMALVFLVLLTMLGITTMNTTVLQERMAGNLRDRNLAFQAAESALLAGENRVGSAITVNTVVADASITNDGLHKPSATTTPVWEQATVWNGSDVFTFTGLGIVAQQPKYLIEDMGEIQDTGGSLVIPQNYKTRGKNVFRITARGSGGTTSALAMVQSTYEKRF